MWMDWRNEEKSFFRLSQRRCRFSNFISFESQLPRPTHNTNSREEWEFYRSIVIVCSAKLRDFPASNLWLDCLFIFSKTSTSGFHNFRHVLFSISLLWKTPKYLIFFFFLAFYGLSFPNSNSNSCRKVFRKIRSLFSLDFFWVN